jgi:hypothetical protein
VRSAGRVQSCAALAALVWSAAHASAAPIAITNHGFESDFAADNTFRVLVPVGWTIFDPNGIVEQGNDAVGVLNPTASAFFPAGAPEGRNAALVFLAQDVGGGPAGLSQNLTSNLMSNTRYTLIVEVGNIASGFGDPNNFFYDLDGFPGYQVQLLAGGEVIVQDNNSLAASIPEGEFQTSTIMVDIGASHPRLGEALEVRLINLNIPGTPTEPAIEVDFDDVRLDASPIPPACPGDADGDGEVNFADITNVLANFGDLYPGSTGPGDANHDGVVEFADVTAVLSNFSSTCP